MTHSALFTAGNQTAAVMELYALGAWENYVGTLGFDWAVRLGQ